MILVPAEQRACLLFFRPLFPFFLFSYFQAPFLFCWLVRYFVLGILFRLYPFVHFIFFLLWD